MVGTLHPKRKPKRVLARARSWWRHPVLPAVLSAGVLAILPPIENDLLSLPFVLALALFAAALLFSVTRRLSFSVCAGWMIVGTLSIISLIKFKMKGFSLHFYDLVFTANDSDAVEFIFVSYPHLVGPVLLLMVVFAGISVLMYRMDRPRDMSLGKRLVACTLALFMLPLTFPSEASTAQRHFYYLQGRHVTAFFVSLLDLQYMFRENELEKRLSRLPPQEPFSGEAQCGSGDRPDIVVVLEETLTNPGYFTQLPNAADMAAAMTRQGETLQPLNVEVFGGGTWISGLSLLTGLSSMDFGWRSPYLTITLQDAIKNPIPKILADCGYHTMAVLPLDYQFVNEGPFLHSIGFETVLDRLDIKAPSRHMRDKFYFEQALAQIEAHRAADGRPLFLYVQTMFAHSPFDKHREPDITLAGEPFHREPALAEYWRRVLISREDYADFSEQVMAGATERGMVMMSFGDHQGNATMDLVEELDGPSPLSRPGSLAYRTYYTLTGSGLPERQPAQQDGVLDIGFLGTEILEAAGIPGSDVYIDLAALKRLCGGAFYDCPDRDAIDRHLRRRIDGGLLDLFPNKQLSAGTS